MLSSLSPGAAFSGLLEVKEFVEKLPGRVNRFLDVVTDRNFEVRVNAIDETKLIEGLQKITNRITLGLVLAALIIGAALLMRIPTAFQIWGYPGLAVLFFLAAGGGALVIAFNIVFHDVKKKPRS